MQEHNPLKNVLMNIKKDLELTQNFFLDNKANYEKIIPRKEMKKSCNCNSKNYSPTKVKVQNFLTNISYNRLKNVGVNNASFIIDCYTYILLNLNPFFLERKLDENVNRDYVLTLWNYLIPCKFYIYIYRNDDFIELNKPSLKYQNAYDFFDTLTTFLNSKDFFKKMH